MRVVIRTDASIRIGTGHVMRCLTLADALRRQGAECRFICRALEGHMAAAIRARGFECTLLPAHEGPLPVGPPDHAHWAEADWRRDAEETRAALGSAPDWLVLDHYAFDARWEEAVCPAGTRLLVLDDLADRPHTADLLLDQNLGRRAEDYDGFVPDHCKRLIGPRYALLRPEFAERRAEALAARAERADQGIRHLLISMGGIDLPNATSKVLEVLPECNLPDDARITVVMGAQAPALERVRALAVALPWQTDVRVNVSDMAALMADADLAIGGAGTTTWERCCLGLPTLTVVLADNQKSAAVALATAEATMNLGECNRSILARTLPSSISRLSEPDCLISFSTKSAAICDGKGKDEILNRIT